MSAEARVQQLLEEMFDSGRSPEEVCTDCPELLDEVSRRWQRIRVVKSELHALFPTPGGHDVDPSGPGNPPVEVPGTRIGPYRLLQQIGEGGFGVVYLAEQEKPVRRVALKIIRPGMDSAQVIARFEAERQALALMDHQNIAKVHDAGTTDNGRPFFVMELVQGLPITRYCDDNHLTVRERLALMVPVCRAVQHAHQKGIIHRDLKPSNVLVCLYEGQPVPKVIDFGVAKAIDSTSTRLTERTMVTRDGQIIGTFEYMSPEQAETSQLGVDTRGDVYSLGVLLYELLTGSTPLARQRLREASLSEVLRMIKEEEPPKPSTRLSGSRQPARIAVARRTEAAKLGKLLRGELDWVVMRCLEKDRARRYDTANALARDLERYLHDEPVEAGPPGAGYRLRKLARKHRTALSVAGTFVALLVLAAGVSIWQAVRATRAEGQAVVERNRAEAEERTAKEREAETRAVLDFVENKILAAARPERVPDGLGPRVTVRRAVEKALPFVGESFHEQPLVEARLRMTLGLSFWYLGEPQIAADQYQLARAIYTARLGPDHSDTLRSMLRLGNCYYDLGRRAEALELREETLALQRARLGPDHLDTLKGMSNLALSYSDAGRHAEALKLQEETLALQTTKLGPDDVDTLRNKNNLANSYAALGRQAEALKLHKETLALQSAKLGRDHPDTLRTMYTLANTYADLGRQAEGLQLHEETLALRKAKLGPDHPDTLSSMNNLANSYASLGRAEALSLREQTLALRKAKLGSDHPDTLRTMYTLANTYADLGRQAEGIKLHEETLALRKAKLGPEHPDTLWSMNDLANSYAFSGRHAEAFKLHEETLTLRKAKLGPEHPDTLMSMNNLANDYAALGRHAEALKLHQETLALQTAKLGADHPDTILSMNNLAIRYAALGRHAEAINLHEETLGLRKAKFGPDHPDTLESMYNIACVHAQMISKAADRGKQADLAMDSLRQAVAAGFNMVAQIKKDTDLNDVRDREDFKKLVADLEAKLAKEKK
jgi:serine/threonine protein kinase/tetratricopeptide (TPR) repeat protein